MQLKSDSTTVNSSAAVPVAAPCGKCGAEERLLHHVRNRNSFRRLCTTCVLRLHPLSFCPTCFQVYPPSPPNDAVFTCSKCYSSSHSQCVSAAGPTPPPNPYTCPLCVNPSTPIFKLKTAKEANEDYRVMDRDNSKKLLAAARIASVSMNKAAVAFRAESEKRAKEAAFARKRAKEALDHVAFLMMKEKSRKKEAGDVAGSGSGGVANKVGYGSDVKIMGENNVNVSSDRNGSVGGGLGTSVAIEEKFNDVANVDIVDNSNQVVDALNVVELSENKNVGGVTVEDEGLETPLDDLGAEMDNVGEMSNENGGDRVISTDLQSGGENINVDDVSNGVALVQPVEDNTIYKESVNVAETHANGNSESVII